MAKFEIDDNCYEVEAATKTAEKWN
ncbi:MAG: hypothetical protein OSB38_22900 [Paraburkholderia fungorum]|nr:hypothetical protein [Paraburkholderia fungorum]